MPIYEYRCQSCEAEFEYMQRISEDPKSECERCGGALEKLISNTSFQLKGAGWYRDLYSSPKPAEASSGDSSSGESKEASKSESKGESNKGESKSDGAKSGEKSGAKAG